MKHITALLCLTCFFACTVTAQKPRFRALAIAENGGHHVAFSAAARVWLNQLAKDSSFAIDFIQKPDVIDSAYLSKYQLFIQLDYAPYGWPPKAMAAFEQYITQGKGGWVGLHHAALLGEFDGFPMWQWFSRFMGGIRFTNYIASFASAQVKVENHQHPCMRNLPDTFPIEQDEWYTWDKSPRPNVQVLASVNEASYQPASTITMGDHPVVWTNPSYAARNIYIFMGHSPALFQNKAWTTLFRNAIFWAKGN
ncbi:ThuA domain-containing protein [Deminuibacter soli]|uniref:ThuA domain-containing protein n=1 Tax=Deminuibacter soli TaxID=2291815 RepID=A0A3E1NCH3_9BACT|nr:ThuA domain-containing protein [Deminuibacter soli]RFM25653.1 ThuA domain-containing protein [Deminuibacter soli]